MIIGSAGKQPSLRGSSVATIMISQSDRMHVFMTILVVFAVVATLCLMVLGHAAPSINMFEYTASPSWRSAILVASKNAASPDENRLRTAAIMASNGKEKVRSRAKSPVII